MFKDVFTNNQEKQSNYRFPVKVAIIVLQMYSYYKCSVALPHGAVGWSAVYDVVFSDHTHLLFWSS